MVVNNKNILAIEDYYHEPDKDRVIFFEKLINNG